MFRHISGRASKIILLTVAILSSLSFASCGTDGKKGEAELIGAYTELFNAVKSKDTERIKKSMSKTTLSFADFISKQQGKGIDEVLGNGMTETTFADSLPKMRDGQTKDNLGHLEVYSSKSQRWEVIPFVFEDGKWKAAFGDAFSGKWKSPGKPMSQIEAEKIPGRQLIPGDNGALPPAAMPINPEMERDALRQPNPTLGPNATPSPVPNNPTLK